MAETATQTRPIRVYEENGKWHADYSPGIWQTFQSRWDALETVRRVAEREGRDVRQVSAGAARELRKRDVLAVCASPEPLASGKSA
jgi:hypothetical protein